MKPLKSSLGIIIFGLANLFLLYEMGGQVSPNVMAFQLMLDFEIGAGMLGLMSAVYFYSNAAMQQCRFLQECFLTVLVQGF